MLKHFYHPRGLFVLGFAEMWGRMTYYGIQALLVLYLTKSLLFSPTHAYTVFGIYATLSFGLPMLGGAVADRLIGLPLAISIGGLLMLVGSIVLSNSSLAAIYIGLALVTLGVGFFKVNVTSQLGRVYGPNDPRRDSGFTIFYTLINVGALIGPIIYGFVAYHYSWPIAFLCGAVGMAISLITYWCQLPYLYRVAQSHHPLKINATLRHYAQAFAYIAIAIVVSIVLFFNHLVFNLVIWLFAAAILAFIVLMIWHQERTQRLKTIAFVILNIFTVFFFAGFMQTGSSMLLFINDTVHHQIGHWVIPASTFASLESFFLIVIAPILVPIWGALSKRYHQHTAIYRSAIGMGLLGLGFIALAFSAFATQWQHASTNWPLWGILLSNALIAGGELAIGPAVIAAVSFLAPRNLQSTFVGIWLLACAFSGYLASILAKLTLHGQHHFAASGYFKTFAEIAAGSFILLVIILIVKRPLTRMIPSK